METWVLERLQEYVGRNDRQSLAPRVERALTSQSMGDRCSYRVERNLPSLGYGLVVTEHGVVPDYARVRRVFHLTNAIVKYYYSPFFLEAQVSGYHARVAWLDGSPVAFTRDGRYCAFTTDRVADFLPAAFFEDNPHLVVCLAIAGDGIPFAKPSPNGENADIIACATEILEIGVREPVTSEEKYALFEKYGIDAAAYVGPFEATDVDKIVDWMEEFQASGGRGIVLKPSERHHRPLKYALPASLLNGAPPWLGLDQQTADDPYLERLLQAACAATEVRQSADDWDWEAIGKSLFAELAATARAVADGNPLHRDYSVWLHDKAAAELLIDQLRERSSEDAIAQLSLEAENDGWRLRFERSFPETTAAVERRLSGASFKD